MNNIEKEKPEKSDGLTVASMLAQALVSKDVLLLEKCLRADRKTIKGTVVRTSISNVHLLLEEIMVRLVSKPHRAHILLEWIREILLVHASSLVTTPELMARLESIHGSLESRQGLYLKMMKLSGRLDLALQSSVKPSLDQEPGLVYNEEDDFSAPEDSDLDDDLLSDDSMESIDEQSNDDDENENENDDDMDENE